MITTLVALAVTCALSLAFVLVIPPFAWPRRRHTACCAHCRNAFEEMELLDKAFDAIIARTPDYPMPNWRALEAQMPDWETIRERYGRRKHG